MKRTTLVLLFASCFSAVMLGQNGSIHNTLATGGSFVIKDGSTTYLSLDQSTGYLSVNKSLSLPVSTGSTLGVIYKGTERFVHDYQANGISGFNTFVGINSGNFTLSGMAIHNTAVGNSSLGALTDGRDNSAFGSRAFMANTLGSYGSAFGCKALASNTTGSGNSAFGWESLSFNTTGSSNAAFGGQALYSNTTGSSNSAFGSGAMANNIEGMENAAFGFYALFSNTGFYNSAFGFSALASNTSGGGHCAFGHNAMYSNTTGIANSAFGHRALYVNTTSNGNCAFGQNTLFSATGGFNSGFGTGAGQDITTGSNNICIGYDAQVPSPAADNQVRIGNTAVTYAGVQVAWTITSDKRWKSNIAHSDLGLQFISKLKPASYTRKNDNSQRSEYGFIAQELEAVLKETGIENAGMLTIDSEGVYQLRYNDLIAPMVKAIQELKTENDILKERLARLEGLYSSLENKFAER